MYYAPRIFGMAGFENTNEQLWGTVIIGVTNVLATFIAIALWTSCRKPIMCGFRDHGAALLSVGALFLVGGETRMMPNARRHGSRHNSKEFEFAYPAVFALLVFIIGRR
jgi:SP family galactose:H+ symporter-like MFS transporter